jgi:hypothetical protein
VVFLIVLEKMDGGQCAQSADASVRNPTEWKYYFFYTSSKSSDSLRFTFRLEATAGL